MITRLSFNPPVIAHRGASGYAPENTLSAFTKAVQLGIKWIEFDVMIDIAELPIIFHDKTLDRVTNGTGFVKDFSYAYLKTLDVGKWFHPMFSGERILTFDELLNFIYEMHLNANIELKASKSEEEKLVLAVLKVLIKFLKRPKRNDLLFSSFSVDTLFYLRKHYPQAQLALLLHEWRPDWEKISQDLNCVSIHVNEAILSQKHVKKIKEMNKGLLSYTVNNRFRAHTLLNWGVDAIFSDFPDRIL